MEKAHSMFALCLLASLASLCCSWGLVDPLQAHSVHVLLYSLGLLRSDNVHASRLVHDHPLHGDEPGPRFSADAQVFLRSQAERHLTANGSSPGADFRGAGRGNNPGSGAGLNPEQFSFLGADGQASEQGVVYESGFDARNLTNGQYPGTDNRRNDWAGSEQSLDFITRIHAHLNRGNVSGKTEQLQLPVVGVSSRHGTSQRLGLDPRASGSRWDAIRGRQIRQNGLREAEENREPMRRGRTGDAQDKARINYIHNLGSNRTYTNKNGRQAPEPEKVKVQITGGTASGSTSSSRSPNPSHMFAPHSFSPASDGGHQHRDSATGFPPPRQGWRGGPGMLHYVPAGRWGHQVKLNNAPLSPGSQRIEDRRSSPGEISSNGNFRHQGTGGLTPGSRAVGLVPTSQHSPDPLSASSAVVHSHSDPSPRGHDSGSGVFAQTETRARDPSSAVFTGSFALTA